MASTKCPPDLEQLPRSFSLSSNVPWLQLCNRPLSLTVCSSLTSKRAQLDLPTKICSFWSLAKQQVGWWKSRDFKNATKVNCNRLGRLLDSMKSRFIKPHDRIWLVSDQKSLDQVFSVKRKSKISTLYSIISGCERSFMGVFFFQNFIDNSKSPIQTSDLSYEVIYHHCKTRIR